MSTYREAGIATHGDAMDGHPQASTQLHRRKVVFTLLLVAAWLTARTVLAWYTNKLGELFIWWGCYLALAFAIAKIGPWYANRRPGFGRQLLAQETEAFLKQAEEAEARELRKRVFLVPARVAPVESAAVVDDVPAADNDARSVGKAEPW